MPPKRTTVYTKQILGGSVTNSSSDEILRRTHTGIKVVSIVNTK